MLRNVPAILILISSLLRSPLANACESTDECLSLGDNALASDNVDMAIKYYEKGVKQISEESSLVTAISLHTNMGTSYSMMGNEQKAVECYRLAILEHSNNIEEIVEDSVIKDASDVAAQASFFLGMTHQEIGNFQKAVNAYDYAHQLDEYHWASLANAGSVLQDHLHDLSSAIVVYNKAYEILTQTEKEPTDPPENPKYILSQLQYRVGLAITYAEKHKCTMQDNPDVEVSCSEMAASAFNMAVQMDPDNEPAKHMLASITADATMKRASNTYVTQLFDLYAENFEHSLVNELGYDGYQRLRYGFDRAFGGQVPMFDLVIDAGCGTGLVGEQFRNISQHLVGVDLSESILEEAKKSRPDLYDETRVGDVMEIFIEMKPVSLIIAGDSYIYFGDLEPLFESMAEGLADGGVAAFTLENASEEDEISLNDANPDWRWQLTASGRFAHRRAYVQEMGSRFNLKQIYYEEMNGFRKEGKSDVRGHIFVYQKQDSAQEL